MKHLFLVSVLALVALPNAMANPFAKVPTETGDFCLDQTIRHLRYLFGDDVEVTDVFSDQTNGTTSYWLTTNLCAGYFVTTFHKNSSCTSAHYGFVPIYIRRVWAFGDCKALLPQDSYPSEETIWLPKTAATLFVPATALLISIAPQRPDS